jgi:hypothetical protein
VVHLEGLEFEALEIDGLALEVNELSIGGCYFPQLTQLEVRVNVDQLQVVLRVQQD